jgi:chromosome segregation ATPase
LKAENAELVQKTKDFELKVKEYAELKASNLELDNKYQLLESQKHKWTTERSLKEEEQIRIIETFKVDIEKMKEVMDIKLKQLTVTDAELVSAKDTIKDKEREIEGYKKLLDQGKEEIQRYIEDRKALEREYNIILETKKTMQIEHDRILSLNERLSKANKENIDKERERSVENSKLLKQIAELSTEMENLRRDLNQKQRELEIVKETKKSAQKDLDKSGVTLVKLQEEIQRFTLSNKEYEDERANLNKRLVETIEILGQKEEELRAFQMKLSQADERILELEAANARLGAEYESGKITISKYEEDLEFQRKGIHSESSKVYEIMSEKERIERELVSKDLEIKSLKAEMEKVKTTREIWMEERYKFSEEFESLKEHLKVLQAQNDSVINIVIIISYIWNSINSLKLMKR